MASDNYYDYGIIGQGLAGTLLGYFLERSGASCYYIDAPEQTAASAVAAGIINPITGRRFVKSWLVEELLPFAAATYRELEVELGEKLYFERGLLRTLFNRGEENDWLARTADPAYEPYLTERAKLGAYADITAPAFAYGEVKQASQVAIGKLVKLMGQRWTQEGRREAVELDYRRLSLQSDGIAYGDKLFGRVICCEGWRVRHNPFFNYLPINGNKGEVLLIRLLRDIEVEKILKHRLFVVPLEDGLYWIGSTSDNQFSDDRPTAQGGDYLHERLADLLTVPYEVVDHRAAVRPTIRDRRPCLGLHPNFPRLGVFNGLGTKGASLAPYWADHLARHLLNEEPLAKEVDVARFANMGPRRM